MFVITTTPTVRRPAIQSQPVPDVLFPGTFAEARVASIHELNESRKLPPLSTNAPVVLFGSFGSASAVHEPSAFKVPAQLGTGGAVTVIVPAGFSQPNDCAAPDPNQQAALQKSSRHGSEPSPAPAPKPDICRVYKINQPLFGIRPACFARPKSACARSIRSGVSPRRP